MGYSLLYLGDATFPPGTLDGWLDTCPSSRSFDDWPSRWGLEFEEDAMQVEETTRELLAVLSSEAISDVQIGADRIRVRTLVPKDGDGWVTYRAALAAAFRGVGALGGTASFHAVTHTDAGSDAGFLVESAPGDDRCISLSASDVRAARTSPAGRELGAVLERWLAKHQ